MKNTAEAQIGSLPSAGFAENIRASHRQKMLGAFLEFKGGDSADSVLDVASAGSEGPTGNSHSFQAHAAPNESGQVTKCGVSPAGTGAAWRVAYPNAQGMQIENRRLPFGDQEFDWVYCNGVIENAGSPDEQDAFLSELWRVARKGVFLTTSNRKHPIEFHTGLPLLHWLPKGLWMRSLKWAGKDAWAQPSLLNLLDAARLGEMAKRLPGSPDPDIGHVRFAVAKAHFFLMLRKAAPGASAT